MTRTRETLLYLLFFLLPSIFARELKTFSNFRPGNTVYGPESTMSDYVTLTNDPTANLPEQFTICYSLLTDFMTTQKSVQIYKSDGTPWFSLALIKLRTWTTRAETLSLWYESGK